MKVAETDPSRDKPEVQKWVCEFHLGSAKFRTHGFGEFYRKNTYNFYVAIFAANHHSRLSFVQRPVFVAHVTDLLSGKNMSVDTSTPH